MFDVFRAGADMIDPAIREQIDILRRIAERGRSETCEMGYDAGHRGALDIFQHLIDEIERLRLML